MSNFAPFLYSFIAVIQYIIKYNSQFSISSVSMRVDKNTHMLYLHDKASETLSLPQKVKQRLEKLLSKAVLKYNRRF